LDISKAARLLNWVPTWSFEQTIQKTINWYKRNDDGENPHKIIIEQIKEFTNT